MGPAPDFTRAPMRRIVLENAHYWLRAFRFDGLRLDATHAMVDPSPRHILRELSDSVKPLRPTRLLIAEDDRNDPDLREAMGLDGLWADDFHHAVRVTLTGEQDGYYAAYPPGLDTVAKCIQQGWLYTGQPYPLTGRPRGKPAAHLPAEAFVYCLQNHDQVGNRALGDRLSTVIDPDSYAAVSALLAAHDPGGRPGGRRTGPGAPSLRARAGERCGTGGARPMRSRRQPCERD